MPYRFLVLMLAVVLVITLATPAKAEAFDVMTGLAIAGAALIVLVLVVYLVVANVEGPKTENLDGPRVVQQPVVTYVAVAVPSVVRESP
jgi:hypothetical protein